MFDSHCHVTDVESPLDVLEAASKVGVTSLLCCGYSEKSNLAVLDLRRQVPNLPVAIGIHPWYAREGTCGLAGLLERERPTALGEIGLDGKEDSEIPSLEVQEPVFVAQLEMAYRLRLPVSVHSRKAVERVVKWALAFPGVTGVLHAYAGSPQQLVPLLKRGWMIGVGGVATRPAARRIRRMVQSIPIDSLLLETDSPAIGLQGIEPPHTRPHHLLRIVETVAELRGMTKAELIARTDENAQRLFGCG